MYAQHYLRNSSLTLISASKFESDPHFRLQAIR
jgi:hypothetical protein